MNRNNNEGYTPNFIYAHNKLNTDECNEYDDDPTKYINKILKGKKKVKINSNFIEQQFHDDYRDTLNAFNLITPNQRRLFNRSDMPIININTPSADETKKLISSFIREVNKTVKNHVSDNFTATNWQDNMPEKKYKSGWDKAQDELGLPTSIYTDPAPRAPIRLVKLDHSEKYETDDEIKYVVFLIIQKRNVNDQMVVKVSFVIDKRDWNLDRDFFNKDKNFYETAVKIEEVSIIGFMTANKFGKKSSRDKFYNFDSINDGRMFSQKDIIKELNKKRRQYEKEFVQN